MVSLYGQNSLLPGRDGAGHGPFSRDLCNPCEGPIEDGARGGVMLPDSMTPMVQFETSETTQTAPGDVRFPIETHAWG